jgi:transformation/transcription domain-associated protein
MSLLDQRFQQTHDITLAVSAINCYLQAATLFKVAKARKFGARILWLLTFEDAVGSMAKSFELYNNDLPTWFWIPFIPQLLSSLARKEARLVRFLLIKLAKSFPQALYLPLRTAADEFRALFGPHKVPAGPRQTAVASTSAEETSKESGAAVSQEDAPPAAASDPRRSPVDYTDDLLAILKTGYPLLSLSMENMVEHLVHRLRSTADEDLFRVIVTLLSEAFQVLTNGIN